MSHHLLHAFYVDLWCPIWPNLAASLVWGPLMVWAHERRSKHRHADLLDRLLHDVGLDESDQ